MPLPLCLFMLVSLGLAPACHGRVLDGAFNQARGLVQARPQTSAGWAALPLLHAAAGRRPPSATEPTVAQTRHPAAALSFILPTRGHAGVSRKPSNPLRQSSSSLGTETVLLIMASNRPSYLERCLTHVLRHHPGDAVPIVISQDGDAEAVAQVVARAQRHFEATSSVPLRHIHHLVDPRQRHGNGYARLAQHYRFALDWVFNASRAHRVILLEEDLEIAPDFFEYFAATAPLLDADASLLAVSAWNDNGLRGMARDPTMIYRSDFFPGLGWMLTRRVWGELSVKWPDAYWDDWMREPEQRKGRHTLRPEVCRTLHYGTVGVSHGQYSHYWQRVWLNSEFVQFTAMNLSYIASAENWERHYLSAVTAAPMVTPDQFAQLLREQKSSILRDVRLVYRHVDGSANEPGSFALLATLVGAMADVKAGVPRTAYKGIVTVYKDQIKVHIVPKGPPF